MCSQTAELKMASHHTKPNSYVQYIRRSKSTPWLLGVQLFFEQFFSGNFWNFNCFFQYVLHSRYFKLLSHFSITATSISLFRSICFITFQSISYLYFHQLPWYSVCVGNMMVTNDATRNKQFIYIQMLEVSFDCHLSFSSQIHTITLKFHRNFLTECNSPKCVYMLVNNKLNSPLSKFILSVNSCVKDMSNAMLWIIQN